MSQESDPNTAIDRVELRSLDVAEQKRQDLLRLFPEVRTESGKMDFDRLKLTLGAISGHLSRRMLEHYSHIRLDAKRHALDALDAARRSAAHNGDGNGDGAGETKICYPIRPPPSTAAIHRPGRAGRARSAATGGDDDACSELKNRSIPVASIFAR